jgi:hypothetical protein
MKRILLVSFVLSSSFIGVAQERWNVYMFEMDSLFASVTVNVAADELDPDHQKCFLVKAKLQFIGDHTGFPTRDAYEMIDTYEQCMDDFIYLHPEAQIVGSCMHDGEREMYIYTSDTSKVRKELEGIRSARFPSLKVIASIESDPEWTAFWDFLFPNTEQIEYINNMSVLNQLVEAGDDLSKPREVYYWFYSEDEAVSNVLKEDLLAEGFSLISGGMMEGDLPFSLILSRVDYVDIQSITSVTLGLNQLAAQHASIFDGWETTVIAE